MVCPFVARRQIGINLLFAFLISCSPPAVEQEHSVQCAPVYRGFKEIETAKSRFIIVGDTQRTSHWEVWRERNARERKLITDETARRDPAFVVHLGDLTVRGGAEKYWHEFDDLHKNLREKKIAYFPILGNHEFYGNRRKALQHYFSRFPHLEYRRWYSFSWMNIGLILVDSNFSNLAPEQIEEQAQWYLGELEKFEKDERVDYVIVCCHEPPFTNSRVVDPNKKVKVLFADPFIQFHKACIFFSGHSHTYERFLIGGKFFVVSGGGGGPRHKVFIDPAKHAYQDLFSGAELRFFHFCEIEIQDGTLIFKVVSLDSERFFNIVDQLTIVKTMR